MAVFRVERNRNYTVMSNYHLRDRSLSMKAKGLLSLILSLPDNWRYSIAGLAAISKEGEEGIASGLRELENAGYLTRKQLRGEHGRMGQTEYTIYEVPQTISPSPEMPVTVTPDTDEPEAEVPSSELTAQEKKEEETSQKPKKEKKKNDLIKNPIKSYQAVASQAADEMRSDRVAYRDIFLENIDYELIRHDYQTEDDLNELIEIALDTLCATKPYLWINGNKIPTDTVRSRILKLNSEHIRYILDCLHDNTTRVKNIRQYLVAALYNAPVTISNYYTALVNHDLYGSTQ